MLLYKDILKKGHKNTLLQNSSRCDTIQLPHCGVYRTLHGPLTIVVAEGLFYFFAFFKNKTIIKIVNAKQTTIDSKSLSIVIFLYWR